MGNVSAWATSISVLSGTAQKACSGLLAWTEAVFLLRASVFAHLTLSIDLAITPTYFL